MDKSSEQGCAPSFTPYSSLSPHSCPVRQTRKRSLGQDKEVCQDRAAGSRSAGLQPGVTRLTPPNPLVLGPRCPRLLGARQKCRLTSAPQTCGIEPEGEGLARCDLISPRVIPRGSGQSLGTVVLDHRAPLWGTGQPRVTAIRRFTKSALCTEHPALPFYNEIWRFEILSNTQVEGGEAPSGAEAGSSHAK